MIRGSGNRKDITPLKSGGATTRPAITLFAVVLAASALPSLANDDLEYFWWSVGTLGSACALFILPSFLNSKFLRAIPWIIGSLSLLLGFLTLGEGYATFSALQMNRRIQLFFGNPNLLAASLALSGIAALVVLKRSWFFVLLVFVNVPAILLTGSRTALLAFAASTLLCFTLGESRLRRHLLFLLAAILLLVVSITLLRPFLSVAASYTQATNLLSSSNDLRHPAWHKTPAKMIAFNHEYVSSPRHESTAVTRLQAESSRDSTSGLVLFQGIGIAEPGTQFVVSAYFRAIEPQIIVLSSNFTQTTCTVDIEWRRCTTPVATGNGHGHIQFQLRTSEPGGSIDVYMWGAQVEEGTSASEAVTTSKSVVSAFSDSFSFRRLFVPVETLAESIEARRRTAIVAWRAYTENPFFGLGFRGFSEYSVHHAKTHETEAIDHAHNIYLHLLAETGIFGLLAYILPFFGTACLIWTRSWRLVSPLLLVSILLNLTDFTYYHVGSYYIYWLTLGTLNAPQEDSALESHEDKALL